MSKAKTNKITCTTCGKEKPSTVGFYLSHSKLYKCNQGRMPVCKDCFFSRYKEFLIKYNDDEKKALYAICMQFDIYFDTKLIERSQEDVKNDEYSLLKTYMKNVNSLPQYRGKDSLVSEYVILDENVLTELENKYKKEPVDNSINYEELDISDDTKLRWGSGYTNEDYKFLEDTYKEFTDVYESRTPAQRLIFKNIAKSLLEGDKALRNNNPKIFENMNNVVSKLMTDGNIKPIQEASVAEDDTASWGKWINLIEQERPIGEPLEHFKDVDKISSYITKWFTRQMQRVFDLSTGDNNDN